MKFLLGRIKCQTCETVESERGGGGVTASRGTYNLKVVYSMVVGCEIMTPVTSRCVLEGNDGGGRREEG